jgi:hypothetical protein
MVGQVAPGTSGRSRPVSRAAACLLAGLLITLAALAHGEVRAEGQSIPPALTGEPASDFALFGPGAEDRLPAHIGTMAAGAVIANATVGLSRPPGAIPVIHTEGTLPGRGIREISGRAREDFPISLSLGLAYRLTGSVAVLGVVGFAQAAPTLLVSPVAGLLADRYPRRRMLIGLLAAVALLGLVLAALTATGHVTPTLLIAVAVLRGLAFAFEIPIRPASGAVTRE